MCLPNFCLGTIFAFPLYCCLQQKEEVMLIYHSEKKNCYILKMTLGQSNNGIKWDHKSSWPKAWGKRTAISLSWRLQYKGLGRKNGKGNVTVIYKIINVEKKIDRLFPLSTDSESGDYPKKLIVNDSCAECIITGYKFEWP